MINSEFQIHRDAVITASRCSKKTDIMEKEVFDMPVRTYTKKELSKLYAPELTEKAAGKRLCQWIKLCKPLWDELQKTGYNPLQRILNPMQVRLIFRYLGEP